MIKIFINLTNGIESLEQFNFKIADVSFIRIQSCHCESHKFDKILQELDNNFLMHLAMGYECIVYDYGSNSEKSKAVNAGCEWIKFVLNQRWLDKDYIPTIKNQNLSQYYLGFYNKLDKKTKKRIDYFKKFVNTFEINLKSVSSQTNNDGNISFYTEIIKRLSSY